MGEPQITTGQRVWIADESVPAGRRYGRIFRIDPARGVLSRGGVTIVLEESKPAVTCSPSHRGVEWDVAEGRAED
jgi:hypothetical protein